MCGTSTVGAERVGTVLKIEFAEPEQIRSRRVLSRSRAGHTGTFPSWKMGRMVHWESIHELNAFRILDADPTIVRFSEQPCLIRYVVNGREKLHFPDILIESRKGKELWEIKADRAAKDPDVVERTECLMSCLPEWGYRYRVVQGREVASQPRLHNALTVLRYGRHAISKIDRELARRAFRDRRQLRWQDARAGVLGPKGRIIVCRLVLEGLVEFDTANLITPDTSFCSRSWF